jgi:hypothetical protein
VPGLLTAPISSTWPTYKPQWMALAVDAATESAGRAIRREARREVICDYRIHMFRGLSHGCSVAHGSHAKHSLDAGLFRAHNVLCI